ncbi:aldo/keto reductase [Streptomyces lydicamycinicus]|uniref:Aldo/keto reductase n=1 Tax=Streptomyces lydicamycinicus TaxID=1546107 RepID=A0A0P4R5X1_9ACTN|nr:aldo/keto reductase [Streptomyces lydicamycinicus]
MICTATSPCQSYEPFRKASPACTTIAESPTPTTPAGPNNETAVTGATASSGADDTEVGVSRFTNAARAITKAGTQRRTRDHTGNTLIRP